MVITPALDLLLRGSPDISVGLWQLHLVTARQLTMLHYKAGTLKTVQKRLKILADNGFIQAVHVPTIASKSPYVYMLDSKGIRYLKDIGVDVPDSLRGANEVVQGYSFIAHDLELNDLLISAIKVSTVAPSYSLAAFIHERTLKRTPYKAVWQGSSYSLVPDAFLDFHVQTAEGTRRLPLMLEVDRNTEEKMHFRRRIHAYVSFLQSRAYVQLFNTRAITVAFTTLTGMHRVEQMRHWTQAELTERGAANLAPVFVFANLERPLEARNVWFDKRWLTLGNNQPSALLEG